MSSYVPLFFLGACPFRGAKGLPAPRPFHGANGGVVAVGADLRQPLTALPEEMEGEIPAVSATSLGMPFFLPGPL